MKIYKSLVIAAALTPIAAVSTALAGPKAESKGAPARLAGVVTKIDRDARVLTVREDDGRSTTVFVPEGKTVSLSRIGNVLAGQTQPVRRLLAVADGVDLLEVYPGPDEALRAAGVTRCISQNESGHNRTETRGRGWTSEPRASSWRWPARSSESPTRSSGRSTS